MSVVATVSPGNSSLAFIRRKIRRLTASSGTSNLTTATIDEYINNFYSQDFPNAIKLDQMRSVYTFYTQANVEQYPLDVNYNQGVRGPCYIEGIRAGLYKERDQFYNLWPRFPTKSQPATGDGTTVDFTFNVPGPFLQNEVVIGTVCGGKAVSIADDGTGKLRLQVPNAVATVPENYDSLTISPNVPIPGMHNQNTANPGLNWTGTGVTTSSVSFPNYVGTVDYVTGDFVIGFPTAPDSAEPIVVWVSQYQAGRPYSILFWNNYFKIRPVPDQIYKVEVETYLTPVRFLETTDVPILNQWSQYIAYGAAIEILRDRQDFAGVQNLMEGFQRQEALVLERQGTEEIGTPTTTFFNSSQQNYINSFWGFGGPF